MTLNCTSNANVVWEIVGSVDQSPIVIYLTVPPVAQERGFVLEIPPDRNVKRLQVLGSVENNHTVIKCKKSGNGSGITVAYRLSVIGNGNIVLLYSGYTYFSGPPERPGEVRGWVVEFSPLRLRLEWEEPFSHTDHPVLYYTLYTRDGGALFTTNTSSVTFGLEDVEFSSNCIRSADGIEVAAVSDIGMSEPSPVESIWRGLWPFLSE